MAHLLLLCRHISRSDERDLLASMRSTPDTAQKPAAEPAELVAVADRLKETLAQEKVQLTAIRHSRIGANHANWLKQQLVGLDDPPGFSMTANLELDPKNFLEWVDEKAADPLVRELVDLAKTRPPGAADGRRAVLVVGHMPQLGWLGSRLTGNRSLGTQLREGYVTPLTLTNAEVAAIAIADDEFKNRPRGRLDWFVTPDEAAAIAALREKIQSKMDIAKLLGGFMTLVLGGVVLAPGRLDELRGGGDAWAVSVAAVAFLIAVGLYLRTMYAYDTLLMPPRYWPERAPRRRPPGWLVRRPPSSAAWVLYQNMLYIWTFVFTPATVAVIVGLLALAYAALDPGWLEGVLASLFLVGVTFYALQHRPVLGSQD